MMEQVAKKKWDRQVARIGMRWSRTVVAHWTWAP